MPPKSTTTRNTAIVAAAYILSNIAGFGVRLLVAANFDTFSTDAFWTAFRVPDLLFVLLAGGTLASAFIPTYTARLAQGQKAQAWALAQRVALGVFLVMALVAGVAALAAPWLVQNVIAPQFPPSKAALTASLMRVLLVGTVIFSVSGLLMGLLQSNNAFLAPALAPAAYQIGMVIGATVLSDFGIYGVAFGAVLGAALHLGVQLPALRGLAIRDSALIPNPASLIPNPISSDLAQILRLLPPRILGNGAVEVNRIVNSTLASGMGAGAPSALSNGWAIMILPQAVIGQAIGTVLFPAISAHAAKGERAQFAAALMRALNFVIVLAVPAAVGLVMLGQPLIRLLFERGRFGAQSTEQVAWALAWFATGLVAHAALELITRAFFALQDSRTPAWFSVGSMALNVLLSVALARMFGWMGYAAFGGLALALSVATALETLALFFVLARRTPEIKPRVALRALGKSAIGALAMIFGIYIWMAVRGDAAWATLVAVGIAVFVYFDVMWLLKSEEAQYVVSLLGVLGSRRGMRDEG